MTDSVEDVDLGMDAIPETTQGANPENERSLDDVYELSNAIRAIIRDGDLETLSRRRVRLQLEDQFQTDLSSYKELINTYILQFIREEQEEEEEEASKGLSAPKRKRSEETESDGTEKEKSSTNPFQREVSISPELARIVGSNRLPRNLVVKTLWAYIHAHELQDPKERKMILLDDKLKEVFKRDSFTCFDMNKYLKRHMRKPEDLPVGGWDEIPRDGASSEEEEAPKKKRKSKRDKPVRGERPPPPSRDLSVSPELAEVIGDKMPRTQVVKKMWDYIKEKDLQDPKDGRRIILDETLRKIFRTDSMTMFSMNKYLKGHLKKPEDLPESGWDGLERVLPDDV